MQAREIREHFARVKAAYHRNDGVRALASLIKGLEGALRLPSGLSSELRAHLREAIQYVTRDDLVSGYALLYQPGEEKALLARLCEIHANICGSIGAESPEAATARKLDIDRALIQGMRELKAGRASEADALFQQAAGQYRDEHRLFFYIGKALHENGASKRAVPYLKRGLEVAPDDVCVQELLDDVMLHIKGEPA